MTLPFRITLLKKRLIDQDLPGLEAHRKMFPGSRKHVNTISIEGRTGRKGAVMVILFPKDDNDIGVILTERSAHLRDHAGQVSFPGGRQEAGESYEETAIRETKEELNLDISPDTLLGRLSPLYIPPTDFTVHPLVCFLPEEPVSNPDPSEVEKVFTTSLDLLLEKYTRNTETRFVQNRKVVIPYFNVKGYKVWGATAMMLSELITIYAEIKK